MANIANFILAVPLERNWKKKSVTLKCNENMFTNIYFYIY